MQLCQHKVIRELWPLMCGYIFVLLNASFILSPHLTDSINDKNNVEWNVWFVIYFTHIKYRIHVTTTKNLVTQRVGWITWFCVCYSYATNYLISGQMCERISTSLDCKSLAAVVRFEWPWSSIQSRVARKDSFFVGRLSTCLSFVWIPIFIQITYHHSLHSLPCFSRAPQWTDLMEIGACNHSSQWPNAQHTILAIEQFLWSLSLPHTHTRTHTHQVHQHSVSSAQWCSNADVIIYNLPKTSMACHHVYAHTQKMR